MISVRTALRPPAEMTARRFSLLLAACALGGLILRVVYVYQAELSTVSSDGLWFHLGANYLAEGKGFLNPYGYFFTQVTEPGASHPPAWMLVLSMGSFVGLKTM